MLNLDVLEEVKCKKAVEIIPDKLYWMSDCGAPKALKEQYFFSIDQELKYQAYHRDFGPLNLADTTVFCRELQKLLDTHDFSVSKIYHYCDSTYDKKANAAYLMGAFQVIMLGRSPREAVAVFKEEELAFFRDATDRPCHYKCKIRHCLEALEFAIKLGWYDPKTFDVEAYRFYSKVENGDLNWVIPKKFLAMSTPVEKASAGEAYTPEFYMDIFSKIGVNMIIRLSSKEYDRKKFLKKGFKHLDLEFTDGGAPPDSVLETFLNVCENHTGGIAVHCKAGLGRTGTLIACYAIKNYKIPVKTIIAWTRICRPGSIIGEQQSYLLNKEYELLTAKSIYGKTFEPSVAKRLEALKIRPAVVYSVEPEEGQGEHLMEKKRSFHHPT